MQLNELHGRTREKDLVPSHKGQFQRVLRVSPRRLVQSPWQKLAQVSARDNKYK